MRDFVRWVCVGCAFGTVSGALWLGVMAPYASAALCFVSAGLCVVAMILSGSR